MILAVLIVCQTPILVNHSKIWVHRDSEIIAHASKRCGEIFPDAPCLKRLVKVKEQAYNIYCGGINEIKNKRH